MFAAVSLLCFILSCQANSDIYKDTSYPYKEGDLEVAEEVYNPNLMPTDKIPMHTTVYYPVGRTEQIPVHYFIGGFDGIIPAESYSIVLRSLASHGYIVCGSWALRGVDGANFTHHAHMENVKWLKSHIHEDITAKPMWDLLSLSCHSAGCDTTYRMTVEYTVTANVMWEPVSSAVKEGVNFVSPNMILGALLAKGRCSYEGVDHVTHYNYWTCPKVLMEAEEFGHCDLLDPLIWTVCDATNFCPIGIKELVNDYRMFVQGIAASWLNAYVQGQPYYLDYVVDQDNIPSNIKLSLYETDVTCPPSNK